jgi:tetratricopeptide (TPR) repeat protein
LPANVVPGRRNSTEFFAIKLFNERFKRVHCRQDDGVPDFMKKIVILSLSALIFAACGGDTNQPNVTANRQTANTSAPPAASQNNNSLVVSSHSTSTTASSNSSSPADQSSSTSPMSKPVDVSAMTAKIEKAEKEYKAKPDDKVKKNLAAAYFERAFALTKAAQYRAALGDFRKGLKLNPDDKEAQSMHDQIIDIFKSIGREPPKEGEEPPPLPIK